MRVHFIIQRLFLLFLFVGLGNLCQAEVPEGKFRIRWRLNNIPDSVRGVVCTFNPRMGASRALVDFALRNGEMVYEDTISHPKHVRFFGWGEGFPTLNLDLWLDKGGWIDIQGNDKWLQQWTITTNIPQQEEALAYNNCVAEETNEFWMNVDTFQVHDNAYRVWFDKTVFRQVRKTFDYMKTAPVTEVWMDKFLEYVWIATSNPDSLHSFRPTFQQLYARMPVEWQKTENGELIESYAFPAPIVEKGDDMVDGLLYDVDEKVHHLSELKGRYILLDFWSVYCGPCRMAEPELEEITQVYGEKFALVGICKDNKEQWSKFLREHKMPGYQWNELNYGGRNLASRYQTGGIPHFVLISPEGKVIDIWKGYRKGSLKAKMKQLIK